MEKLKTDDDAKIRHWMMEAASSAGNRDTAVHMVLNEAERLGILHIRSGYHIPFFAGLKEAMDRWA